MSRSSRPHEEVGDRQKRRRIQSRLEDLFQGHNASHVESYYCSDQGACEDMNDAPQKTSGSAHNGASSPVSDQDPSDASDDPNQERPADGIPLLKPFPCTQREYQLRAMGRLKHARQRINQKQNEVSGGKFRAA